MELTLRRFGLTQKVIAERAEEGTPHDLTYIYRRHHPEQHRDHQMEYLRACGSRYGSPLR